MNIAKQYKPEKAASRDEARPILQHVYLDTENACLYATDTFMMARVPVDCALDDEPGPIPPDALVQARKRGGEVASNATVTVPGFADYARPDLGDGKPPDFAAVWPKGTPIVEIGLDASLLHKLAAALGNSRVRLGVLPPKDGRLQGIIVQPLEDYAGAKGLLMPIKLGEIPA